jgi:Flp pilus assembly protein TadD/nucleoside phosphorylase
MGTKKAQKEPQVPEPPVDFVIVTALPEERDALLAKLPSARKLDKGIRDIHTFYAAQVKTRRKDRSEYSVIVTCLVKMGPITATAQTVSVVTKWQPRHVMLVGIACGIRGVVKHGDVLIPSQVADYTIGKQEGGQRKINWDVYPCGVSLLDSANDLRDAWRKGIGVVRPGPSESVREKGVVASGGDVIQDDEIVAAYSKSWPKLIGIEMESGGVAAGVHQTADRPEFLMIKSVSNFGKDKHDPEVIPWRPYACHTASAFAVALMKSGPSPSLAIANCAGARGVKAEEKRRQGERQWEYLLAHSFRTLDCFLILKADVGRDWLDSMLSEASLSFDREGPSVRLASLVSAAMNSKEAKDRYGERGFHYWTLYRGEEGYWVSRRGPGRVEDDLVAGINGTVSWSALGRPDLATLRDLSQINEFGISLPPRAFDVGVEELELIFHGDGFSFHISISEEGIFESLHEMARMGREIAGDGERMTIGTSFAGGQLLDMFFKQYMRRWQDEPKAPRRPYRGRMGMAGPSGKEITFYPSVPMSFRDSPEEKEYSFTIHMPDRKAVAARIAELETLVKAGSVDSEIFVELAVRHVAQGRLLDALSTVQRAEVVGAGGRDVHRVSGQILGEMGRHNEAVAHFRKAVAMDEQCAGSITGLAIALAASGDQAGAVEEFRRALAMEPANTGYQRNLAFALVHLGESTESIGYLEKVVASTPNDSAAMTLLGVLLEHFGREDEAGHYLEKAARVPKAEANAFVQLGLYQARGGNHATAVLSFQRAAELEKEARTYELLGGSLAELERLAEAEKAFREACTLASDNAAMVANLGAVIAQQGALERAIPHLKRAVELDPANEMFQNNLEVALMRSGRGDQEA